LHKWPQYYNFAFFLNHTQFSNRKLPVKIQVLTLSFFFDLTAEDPEYSQEKRREQEAIKNLKERRLAGHARCTPEPTH